jgi:hypothetical protein
MRSMPRYLRYLRIGFSITCGIVAVLLVVLWIRSYRAENVITIFRSNSIGWHVVFWDGQVAVTSAPYVRGNPGAWRLYNSWEPGIFGFNRFATPTSHSVKVPAWSIPTILASLATLPWPRWRFSLRTMLIVTTIIGLLLGLIIATTR